MIEWIQSKAKVFRCPKAKIMTVYLICAFELVEYLILCHTGLRKWTQWHCKKFTSKIPCSTSVHAFGKDAEVNLRLHPDELFFPVPDINSGEASSWTSGSYYSFSNTSDIIIISRSPKQLVLDGNITHSRYDNGACSKWRTPPVSEKALTSHTVITIATKTALTKYISNFLA